MQLALQDVSISKLTQLSSETYTVKQTLAYPFSALISSCSKNPHPPSISVAVGSVIVSFALQVILHECD